MDYMIVGHFVSVLNAALDLGSTAAVSEAVVSEVKQCYQLGAFYIGTCDLSESTTDAGISYAWILVNLLFAVMFFNPNIKRGWKVLTFLIGMPGTLFITAFMELFMNKR